MSGRDLFTILEELKALKAGIRDREKQLEDMRSQRHDLYAEALATGKINLNGISLYCEEYRTTAAVEFNREIKRRARQGEAG